MLQAFIKESHFNGIDLDPFIADRKANNYIVHHVSKLAANSIGTENLGRRKYVLSYDGVVDAFLKLFKWFRDFRQLMSENSISHSNETLLLLKTHLTNVNCELLPSVVMCVLNVPLEIAITILPQNVELNSVSKIEKSRCAYRCDTRRCKMKFTIDKDVASSTSMYCHYHRQVA